MDINKNLLNQVSPRRPRPVLSFWIFPASAVLLLISGSVPGKAAGFEVEAKYVRENFKLDGMKFKRFSGNLTVQQNNDQWTVIHRSDEEITSAESTFGGTDVFTLAREISVQPEDLKKVPHPEAFYEFKDGVAHAHTLKLCG